MKNIRYLFISLVFAVFLSACSSEPQNGKEIVPFSYTDQNGQPFGTDELAGKVWIADFVFTKCKTVCPPMTLEMADLQKKFKDEGIQVEFVSFTVDPTIDSPDVLKEYIHQFTDDETNWHMLTGYTQEEIEAFRKGTISNNCTKTFHIQSSHSRDKLLFDRSARQDRERIQLRRCILC